MRALLLLALSVARPLPDPADEAEGRRATQCVFLYRLQPTDPGVDAASCEAAGYGLEFMRERWAEIDALQAKRAAALAHAREEARLDAEAQAARAALTEPCRAHFEDGAPAPDGGAAWCERAGLSRGYFNRVRYRERARDEQERLVWWHRAYAVAAGLALLGLVVRALRRRRG